MDFAGQFEQTQHIYVVSCPEVKMPPQKFRLLPGHLYMVMDHIRRHENGISVPAAVLSVLDAQKGLSSFQIGHYTKRHLPVKLHHFCSGLVIILHDVQYCTLYQRS